MAEKKRYNRIIFNVPKEVHEEIKKRVDERYTTIRQYVLQAVMMRMREEDKINSGCVCKKT